MATNAQPKTAKLPNFEQAIFLRLQESELFKNYCDAFRLATGLPLRFMRSDEQWCLNERRDNQSPFCELLHRCSTACNECKAVNHKLIEEAEVAGPSSCGCFAGLCATAVPIRIGATTNPLSPPSDPVQRRLQSPPAKSKFLAVVTLAGGALGGDVDTYTVTGTGTKHWNLSWDTILTARGSFSVVDEYSGDGTAPIFERQFLGGSRDLRGFEYRDLGPRDPVTNEVIGGGTSAFVSLELTFPITERVRGAAFYDTGFVNVDSWDFGGGNLASDAGLGLRMDLPIGPLAVDYAIPLSTPDDEADNGGQFNFYLNYQYLILGYLLFENHYDRR